MREPDNAACLPQGEAEVINKSVDGHAGQGSRFFLFGRGLLEDFL
jgi:hypothetical protein